MANHSTETPRAADVIIAGGGVIGSSIAYFLASEPAFSGSILVVEKDPSYASSSTSLSVGAIRQQFSTLENIDISSYGIQFLKSIHEHLSIDGDVPDISLVEAGYLFLATEHGLPILHQNHELQKSRNVDVQLLAPEELSREFPWMNTSDLAAGSLGRRNEGWFDPYGLLMAFKRKAQSLGVTYLTDSVDTLVLADGRVSSVLLASGNAVNCGVLVNAAGPHARQIAALAGVDDLPVYPRKRYVYTFECREELGYCPLVINPNGVYFRPEGGRFICGTSPPADSDPNCLDLDLDMDYSLFDEIVWPTLAARVPAFDSIKRGHSWAGHYAYNVLDQNAVLGMHPEINNFCFANGFSGHGMQQSPAVGRAISELLCFGEYRSLDLSKFAFERFANDRLIQELNVI